MAQSVAVRSIDKVAGMADELMCRVSNGKVHLFTELGKAMLPAGHWGGPSNSSAQPTLYLTFDDGPHPKTTPALLKLLAEQNIKATFFLIGANCRRYPHLVKRIQDAGHQIGNHTENHQFLPLLTTAQLRAEIANGSDIIEELTGARPTLFRPPFGLMDDRAARIVAENGMTPVYWNAAPEDWLIPGTHRIIRRVMWKIADGTLIVLHEGANLAEQTANAAAEIIERSVKLGYRFAKVNVGA